MIKVKEVVIFYLILAKVNFGGNLHGHAKYTKLFNWWPLYECLTKLHNKMGGNPSMGGDLGKDIETFLMK